LKKQRDSISKLQFNFNVAPMTLTVETTRRLSKTESYRGIFPHLNHQLYLNHAAVSPLSSRVVAAINSYLKERNETDIENYFSTLMPVLDSVRSRVASFINSPTRNLAFVQNTSAGLSVLAQGLNWKSGDRILLYEKEFPSNVYPFLNLKAHGVEVDFVPCRNGKILLEDVERLITPRTRLVSVSYVQFLTGFRIDLATLADLCHSKGVLLSVDAIQALGAMPIDCKAMKFDFLAAGAHKWAMSPMGNAVMFISDDLLERLTPSCVGWLSVKEAWELLNYEQDLHDSAQRYEAGTYNWIGLVGMNEAFGIFHELGSDVIAEKLLGLTTHLRERLSENGFKVAFEGERKNYSGIVSIQGLQDPTAVMKQLLERHIEVSTREGLLRISPHFYNTTDELDRFVDELNRLTK